MATSLVASAGWVVSHWFYRIDRARWRALSEAARADAITEAQTWLAASLAEEGLQLIPLALIGKGDVGFMAVHPDLRRHQQLGQEIAAGGFGACLTPAYSFLSMSEASEYLTTEDDWARTLTEEQKVDPSAPEFETKMASFRTRMAAYAESRLHPRLPDNMAVVCFYPMAKARRADQNWYTLPFEERKKLMQGHGEAGRRYAEPRDPAHHHLHRHRRLGVGRDVVRQRRQGDSRRRLRDALRSRQRRLRGIRLLLRGGALRALRAGGGASPLAGAK